jgi:hypothetical protein
MPRRFPNHAVMNYTSPRTGRQALIISAVVAFHVAVIFAVAEWPGTGLRSIFAGEIKVTIVKDTAPPPRVRAGVRPGGE